MLNDDALEAAARAMNPFPFTEAAIESNPPKDIRDWQNRAREKAKAAIEAYLSALPVSHSGVSEAAKALCDKLDLINEDGRMTAAFQMAAIHGCEYDGPQYGEDLKALKDALAAHSGYMDVSDGWRPIDSAPKDGTEIIAAWECRASGEPQVSPDVYWWEHRKEWISHADGLIYPTKWQPLPEPPKAVE